MSEANESSASPVGQPGRDGGVSIARRHALLKGLGKGAAIAGAAVPLSSLGASTARMKLVVNNNAVVCTVSGTMSVLVSAVPATQCSGFQFSQYRKTATILGVPLYGNWPSGATLAGYVPGATFASVFKAGSTTATLGSLIDKTTPTDESYWVLALLNSYLSTYPYPAAEVIGHYQTKATALSFHKLVAGL